MHSVPHIVQEHDYDCGPVNLQIAIQFLGLDKSLSELKELMNYEKGEAIYTIEIATAASKLGLKTEFYTAHLFNEHQEEFYDEHARDKSNKQLYSEARAAGVEVKEENLSIQDLAGFISENSIPIVLVDWNTLKQREDGYQGHFVPLISVEDSKVVIHNTSNEDGDFIEFDRELFDKARKAEGTDRDVALIRR